MGQTYLTPRLSGDGTTLLPGPWSVLSSLPVGIDLGRKGLGARLRVVLGELRTWFSRPVAVGGTRGSDTGVDKHGPLPDRSTFSPGRLLSHPRWHPDRVATSEVASTRPVRSASFTFDVGAGPP